MGDGFVSETIGGTGVGYTQLLKLSLLRCDKFSVIPLLHEIFGEDSFYRFLEMFAGVSFHVPSLRELEASVRDVNIYKSFCLGGDATEITRHIAQEYDLSEAEVCRIKIEMESLVNTLHSLTDLDDLDDGT